MKRNLLTIMLAFLVVFGVNAQKADLTKVTGVSDASKVIECAPEAIVSQALGDQNSAGTSNSTANSGAGYKKAAKVENWTYGDLASIRVFAGQLFNDGSWASCDTDPFSFNIVFYADNAGSPGTEIASYTETLNHVSTGDYLFGNSAYGYIYYWDWTPASAVADLPETFWFSFQNNESDCWFMWLNTESGVGAAAGNDGTGWTADDYPLQYCLTNVLAADAAPAAVSNLVVTPSATGAELWWTNPTETYDGNSLTELTSVGAWVSGTTEAIYTNTMAIIGGAENFTWTAPSNGEYTFTVYGTNSAGDGVSTDKTVWIGAPTISDAIPANGTADLPANVNFSWTSAGADTYEVGIWKSDDTPVYSNTTMTTTSFTQTLDWATDYKWSVKAVNSFGEATTGMMTFTTADDPTITTFPWTEDFEGGTLPAGWKTIAGVSDWVISADNSSGFWTIPAHTIYASINDDAAGSGADNSDVWLKTPPMDFSSLLAPKLTVASYAKSVGSEVYTLKSTIDGGSTWSDIQTFNTGTDWAPVEVDLSSLAGNSNVKLAFHYNDAGSWGYGWAIDDIMIQEATGVSNLNSNISIYPNPSNGSFNVTVDGVYNVEVVDITGKVINTQTVENNATVNINNAGIYFLRFSNEKANFVEKVIVK